MKHLLRTLFGVFTCAVALIPPGQAAVADGKLRLRAGILERPLQLSQGRVTGTLLVDGKAVVSTPAAEFSLTISRAEPNWRPDSFKPGVGGEFKSNDTFSKTLTPEFLDDKRLGQSVGWVEPVTLNSAELGVGFGPATYKTSRDTNGLKHVIIEIPAKADGPLPGLVIELHYTVYEDHPVIRKWVSIRNGGGRWLKLDNFTIDAL